MAGHAGHGIGRSWSHWRAARWAAIGVLLLVPLVAMQFSDEVVWSRFDFIFAGTVLAGAALAYEVVTRISGLTSYRAAAGIAIVTAVLLIWVTGAVGIIGTEAHAANLLYAGVLAIALGGALLARFRARGLSRATIAAAVAHVAIAAAALIAGWGSEVPGWWLDILGVTALFVALWVASAWLFRRAARA